MVCCCRRSPFRRRRSACRRQGLAESRNRCATSCCAARRRSTCRDIPPSRYHAARRSIACPSARRSLARSATRRHSCVSQPRSSPTSGPVCPVEAAARPAAQPVVRRAAARPECPAAAHRSRRVHLPCAAASRAAEDARTCALLLQRICRLMLSRIFHGWERRLASTTKDRVVRPFEWGEEWIDGPLALHAWVDAIMRDTPAFFDTPPTSDYEFDAARGELRFPSALTTPHPENNTVLARWFPASAASQIRRGEPGDKEPAILVLPQWNSDAEGHIGLS